MEGSHSVEIAPHSFCTVYLQPCFHNSWSNSEAPFFLLTIEKQSFFFLIGINIILLLLTHHVIFQLFLETGFCISVCARVCRDTCSIHEVPFAVLWLQFLSLFITFFPIFFVFSFTPPLSFLASFCYLLFSFCFFFLFIFSLCVGGVARSCPMPRPPLWHGDWLCPIRSAAGEGGEWDAGSSESGAGSHHTVLRPWNVSATTTTNRAVSPPPTPPPFHLFSPPCVN